LLILELFNIEFLLRGLFHGVYLAIIKYDTLCLWQLLLLEILQQLLLKIHHAVTALLLNRSHALQVLWLHLLLKILQLLHLHPFLTDFDLINYVLDSERIIIGPIAAAWYLVPALVAEATEESRLTRTLRIWLLVRVSMTPLTLALILMYTALVLSIQLTERPFPILEAPLLGACIMHLVIVVRSAYRIVVFFLLFRHLLIIRLLVTVVHSVAVRCL